MRLPEVAIKFLPEELGGDSKARGARSFGAEPPQRLPDLRQRVRRPALHRDGAATG